MANLSIIGTVAGINNGQYPLVRVWESYDFKGSEKFRLWTCWLSADPQLNEGDTIEVEGVLSTKVSSYVPKNETEPRSIVEHHLNNATYKLLKASDKIKETAPVVDEIEMPF